MEHLEWIEACEVSLLILFGYDPGFHAVEDHVVDNDSVAHVDWLLEAEDAKDFELSWG